MPPVDFTKICVVPSYDGSYSHQLGASVTVLLQYINLIILLLAILATVHIYVLANFMIAFYSLNCFPSIILKSFQQNQNIPVVTIT